MAGLAASLALALALALGLGLTGWTGTAVGMEDRAAGAAGGQSPRVDGGPGRVTVSPPSAGRDGLSSPAAPPGADSDEGDKVERGSEKWRVRHPAAGRIAGYSTAASGPAGTRVGLKVSTSAASYRVTADRLGAYEGGTGREVWRTHTLPGREQAAPVMRPEQALTGMMYECYPVDTDYVVASPQWWGFRGTGVARGDGIPGLVGPEADRVYPTGSLPRPLQILSHSPYSCGGVTTAAESVYYTAPSGAGVFNAGTLRWGCAMVDRCERPLGARTARLVRVVTGNVLHGFATGPAGRRHPVHDNVRDFDLSPVNAVSAS